MTTNAMVNKLYTFIKNIPSEFGVDYDSGCLYCIDPYANGINAREIDYAVGCTKIAFISPFCNEVIKIPFNCMIYEHYNGEAEEFEYSSDSFCYANEENGWDYCDTELSIYYRAKAEGLDIFFPKTRFYGMIENQHIYAQEKVIPFYHGCGRVNISDASNDSVKNLKRRCGLDREWLATAIEMTDVETVERLLQFITDNNIDGDLHNGNIGFRDDGFPVILDFSNYNENF